MNKKTLRNIPEPRKGVDKIKKLAREYGRTKGPTEIAKEFGVSKQRVQQIAAALRKSGIDIPRMRRPFGRMMNVAVKELKEERKSLEKKLRNKNNKS